MTDVPLGKHVLEVRIAEVVEETADSRSLVFDIPKDAADKFTYAPGQYLTLRIPSDRTGSVARCYSLSSSPHIDDRLTVTIKRTVNGYGSNWICDNAHAGMHMHVLAPSGVFVPKNLDHDLLLLAGGSGITPMMAIAKSALSQGSGKVVLVYANRDEQSVIFAAALRELATAHPDRLTVIHWLESVQGLPSQQSLATVAAPFAGHEAFICGPGPFMDASEAALKGNGMPADRVHVEVFRSLESDPFAEVVLAEPAEGDEPPASATVELDGETHTVSWPRETVLLDVLLAKGLDAPFSCREGHCMTCACILKDGKVRMLVNDALSQNDIDDGYILACQAVPETDDVNVTFDE
ncbi:ferredoxin--NADP reductase [Mycobacterium sp. CBMA271]|uniref:ferredoxin--NADP reductase n=1 Tax=unclassified Mycobacteroides TaxID=2618759 RepID=UPI00132A4A6D|nr:MULTISPECIES: ferredoxin--NADP reductase [unclassified Mycobacteroides]MUM16931.1 3-ketosteroid-9-alpha-hydroxylase [Mycobacteroides sp. CBMA 326]MUM24080.1 ferredoxin--NADP reductase [Mycobacteroides sp. CBMA 271]